MVKLPPSIIQDKTVESIYAAYVAANRNSWRRLHLGASQIGEDCQRLLWYSFRWCGEPKFDGRMYRLFDTGYNQEKRIITDLRQIGITVYDLHPNTGRQIHYEEYGGHFACNLDGVILGLHASPKTWHILECKSANTKNFNTLKKSGVAVANPKHYAQVQVCMAMAKLDRGYYISVCKDTDEIYAERIHLDKLFAKNLIECAGEIIFRDTPPTRISENPESLYCKWCEYSDICHNHKLPLVSCRTCAHAYPSKDGSWVCNRTKEKINLCQQIGGENCSNHIFIPHFVPLEVTGADPSVGTIEYQHKFTNGPGGIPSKELEKWI